MKYKTREMLFAALFAAFTAICAQICIPFPYTQVQLSMSLLAVFLCGAILRAKYAVLSMLCYILLGVCGMPVFGRLMGGVGVILGPMGGYILSYPVMVLCIAMIITKAKKCSFFIYFLSMCISLTVCYLFGSVWLSVIMGTGFLEAFVMGVAGFVIADLLKALLASVLAVVFSKRLKMLYKNTNV